ncbi:MAG: hypothetical protein ACK4IY_03405, partial [Chitinophagales bacterium]
MAQENELLLFIDSNTIIGRIAENKVFISEDEVGFNIQGNIIFNGTSQQPEDILFIINAKNIFDRKSGIIYQNDSKTVQYISQNGTFYFGDYPIDKEAESLLHLVQSDANTLMVYHGLSNSILGFISGNAFSTPQLVIAAHLYIRHYDIDLEVVEANEATKSIDNQINGGVIRAAYSDNSYFAWIWDGKNLKPAFGNRP